MRFPEYWQNSSGLIPERGVYLYFLASQNPIEQAENLFRSWKQQEPVCPTNRLPWMSSITPSTALPTTLANLKDYALRVVTCLDRLEQLFGQQTDHLYEPGDYFPIFEKPRLFPVRVVDRQPGRNCAARPLPWAPGLQHGWQYNFRNRLGKYYGTGSLAIDLDLWYV